MANEFLIEDAPAYEAIAPPELTPYYGRTSPLEREASGYIAPHVDEFGQVQSTAYDSRAADIEAETLARRFKGQQLYQSLVDGGASPSEAFRLAAPDLLYNDIKGQMKAAPRMSQEPFTPSLTEADGGRIFRRGPQSAQFIPTRSPVVPPEVKAKQDLLRTQISALRRQQADPISKVMGGAEMDKQIAELERQYVANVSPQTAESLPPPPVLETVTKAGPEANKGKGGIEITRQPKAVEVASETTPTISTKAQFDALPKGSIYLGKDGKKYRKP